MDAAALNAKGSPPLQVHRFQFGNLLAAKSGHYLALHKALQGRMNRVTPVLVNELFPLQPYATNLPVANSINSRLELGHIDEMMKIHGILKAKDERLVMASLLNLDVGMRLEVGSLEVRMPRSFIRLGKVPYYIIMASCPHTQTPRFCWVPWSLMMGCTVQNDRWGLTIGSSVQWAEMLKTGGLRDERSTTLPLRSVTAT